MTSAPGPATSAPSKVVTAYRLYIVAAVLGLVGLVVTLILIPASIDAATQQAQRQLQGTNGVDVRSVATAAAVFAAVLASVVSIAFAVLTIVFARKMVQGRNWARITLAVFAGLHVIGLITSGGGIIGLVIALLTAAAAVVAAILTFLPDARPWFQRSAPAES